LRHWGSWSGWSGGSGFSAQNLKHYGPAGGAFAFNGFAPVFHRFLHSIHDFLLGFAFDAVSFGHKNWLPRRFMRRGS